MIHIKSRSNLPGELKGVSRRETRPVEVVNLHTVLEQDGPELVHGNPRISEDYPMRDCQGRGRTVASLPPMINGVRDALNSFRTMPSASRSAALVTTPTSSDSV